MSSENPSVPKKPVPKGKILPLAQKRPNRRPIVTAKSFARTLGFRLMITNEFTDERAEADMTRLAALCENEKSRLLNGFTGCPMVKIPIICQSPCSPHCLSLLVTSVGIAFVCRFQEPWARTDFKLVPNEGFIGVSCKLEPIRKLTYIAEYIGMVTSGIPGDNVKFRYPIATGQFAKLFRLNGAEQHPGLFIDCYKSGNMTRFLSHVSTDPNCVLENWVDGNRIRLMVRAVRNIGPEEMLTAIFPHEKNVVRVTEVFCPLPDSPIKAGPRFMSFPIIGASTEGEKVSGLCHLCERSHTAQLKIDIEHEKNPQKKDKLLEEFDELRAAYTFDDLTKHNEECHFAAIPECNPKKWDKEYKRENQKRRQM